LPSCIDSRASLLVSAYFQWELDGEMAWRRHVRSSQIDRDRGTGQWTWTILVRTIKRT
jgi:hypothetical protein